MSKGNIFRPALPFFNRSFHTSWGGVLPAFLLTVVVAATTLTSHAQEENEFPTIWRELDAETLTQEAQQHWDQLDKSQRKDITEHVWTNHLSQTRFINEFPWPVVQESLETFGNQQHYEKWLSETVSPEAYDRMRQRVVKRVDEGESVVVEGTTIKEVNKVDALLEQVGVEAFQPTAVVELTIDGSAVDLKPADMIE